VAGGSCARVALLPKEYVGGFRSIVRAIHEGCVLLKNSGIRNGSWEMLGKCRNADEAVAEG